VHAGPVGVSVLKGAVDVPKSRTVETKSVQGAATNKRSEIELQSQVENTNSVTQRPSRVQKISDIEDNPGVGICTNIPSG
jgi:hypothetical protein